MAFKLGGRASDGEYVDHGLPADRRRNGGFPQPANSEPVRIVAARHDRCGARTRVRLPAAIPADSVRRLRCSGCRAAYQPGVVEEVGVEAPGRRLSVPEGTWRWLSVPVGAAAVVGALLLIQGQGTDPAVPDREPSRAAVAGASAGGATGTVTTRGAKARGGDRRSAARLVRGARFALALPLGWERTNAPDGASFAAAGSDRDADATLWIERAPELSMAAFEARSLEQLRSLAGSAQVTERVAAPVSEGVIVRLAADAPAGEPQLEVTLRAAGPYRYYLATTLQPDASRRAADGVELIHGSFIPELGSDG